MVPTVVSDVSDPAGVIAYAIGVLSAAMRARRKRDGRGHAHHQCQHPAQRSWRV